MQIVTKFTRMKFQNSLLSQKGVKYDKICFLTKQRKVNFHIINIHTEGYITLNKYIIGIASIGLKDRKMRQNHNFRQNTVCSEQTFTPPKKIFYTDNIRASVTNRMSRRDK